jgi:predicted RNA-binding protein associated with RNAse of E/G family
MITVFKLNPQGEATVQYQGDVIDRNTHGVVIQARWTMPARDLGYTRFEPGDSFTEYYYIDRWFNIFDIADSNGIHKGWYCNIAEPASITDDTIKQIDLLLDVWINPQGQPLLLDEDEFAAATTLSVEQRHGAQQGLQALMRMLTASEEPFARLAKRD